MSLKNWESQKFNYVNEVFFTLYTKQWMPLKDFFLRNKRKKVKRSQIRTVRWVTNDSPLPWFDERSGQKHCHSGEGHSGEVFPGTFPLKIRITAPKYSYNKQFYCSLPLQKVNKHPKKTWAYPKTVVTFSLDWSAFVLTGALHCLVTIALTMLCLQDYMIMPCFFFKIY